ncbi:hypothetical protein NPIL_194121 [Nephila pilipes]|uniref:Uncharacterized protein n=1 Tax=Nephila pilipes TaxID=299642 RepID=A0A8X6T4K5_NEPPI|nr:hypothetical protein NPIL_194121 [Nephila pilipes]
MSENKIREGEESQTANRRNSLANFQKDAALRGSFLYPVLGRPIGNAIQIDYFLSQPGHVPKPLHPISKSFATRPVRTADVHQIPTTINTIRFRIRDKNIPIVVKNKNFPF